MRNIKWLSIFFVMVFGSSVAFADLDPELAGSQVKNESGPYLGFGLNAGQAYATGGSNPGLGFLLFAEPGYVSTRDSWGRIETSLELATGRLAFRRKNEFKEKATVNVALLALAKVGYGFSLGHSMFGVIKAGAGPVMATYESKLNDGAKFKSDALTGIAGQLAYEIVMPQTDSFDMVGGVKLTYVSLDVDEGKLDGEKVSVEDPALNMNLIMAFVGARLSF